MSVLAVVVAAAVVVSVVVLAAAARPRTAAEPWEAAVVTGLPTSYYAAFD